MKEKLNKIDYIAIIVLMLIYGFVSYYKIGGFKDPQTYYDFNEAGSEVKLKLLDDSEAYHIRFYTASTIGDYMLMESMDGVEYHDLVELKAHSVFYWIDTFFNTHAKYFKIVSTEDNQTIGDIQFYDRDNNKLNVINEDDEGKVLVDETDTVPDNVSYMNSTYFDEIYFARTAYEYIHGIQAYEWTHPPVGKLLMTIPILLFGFTPVTYRFMNNFAGLLMIPAMYMLARQLFKSRKCAILAASLITFDNFHLAQSRMGTVDSFLVLFCILAVLFMLRSFDYKELKKRGKYLLLSGIFIGLAIATKWTGLYVGLGLCIIFFINLCSQYMGSIKKFLKNKLFWLICLNALGTVPLIIYYAMLLINRAITNKVLIIYFVTLILFSIGLFYKNIYKDKYLVKLSAVCVISFIVLPIFIYMMSYLLFPNVGSYDGTLKGIIGQVEAIYDYHAYLEASHPFSSKWYQWPIMYRPVWYYSGVDIDGVKSTIVGIGNPAIWWFGIPSFLYVVYSAIRRHEWHNIFIIIFVIATYLPYAFIDRIMFMYHYYIVLPFVMLAIVSLIDKISEKTKNNAAYIIYATIIIMFFVLFYPITSGAIVPKEYVENLKWLDSWIF